MRPLGRKLWQIIKLNIYQFNTFKVLHIFQDFENEDDPKNWVS